MFGRDNGDRGALAALGMLLLAVVVVAFIAPGPRNPADSQIRQPNATSIEKRQPSDIAQPVAGAQEFHPWRDTYAQWLMALFSVAATGVSIWAVGLVRETLKATRKAIHLDNRPWLDFSIEVTSDLDHNDTDFYEKGLGVDIVVTAKNYGGSPAMGVRIKIGEILPKNTDELLDFPYFTGRRDAMRREYSSSQTGGVTIFPFMDEKIGSRSLISESALKRAPKRASLDPDVKQKSIIFQYIVSVLYTSPTAADALETSSAFMFFMSAGRGTEKQIMIGYDDKFRPIPKRKIRLRETGHKRTI